MNYKRSFLLCLLVLAFVFGLMPVLAQTVSITVTPTWNVTTMLTSLDSNGVAFPHFDNGDEYHYLSVAVYATTNVEFWALQMTCTVPVSVLGSYTPDPDNTLTPDDGGDSARMLEPNSDWGVEGDDYVMIPPSFNPTTGAMTLTISRQGQTIPLGANGQSRNLLLATFTYRVKTVAGSATFVCSPITFLSRNASPIGTPVYTAPLPLSISNGLTISGTAQYQARTDHSGIGVICTDNNTQTFSTRTSLTGAWSIPNIRVPNWYECMYFGQLIDNELAPAAPVHEADVYLPVKSAVNLNLGLNQRILPVVLPLGNTARDNTGDPYFEEEIDSTDISAVTSAYGTTYAPATNFGSGDVNNDKTVNRSDLVLVAGNLDLGGGNTWGEHVIISAQRAPSANLFENRIWVNSSVNQGSESTPLRQLISGTNRDFWPALSPDGTQIAFVRAVTTGTGASTRLYYQLFVQNADGTGVATRISPLPDANWSKDVSAPSWSPDGTRIAFIGSETAGGATDLAGYRQSYNNGGEIYVVDANGRNFHLVTYAAKIYPPTWWGNSMVVFGGADWNNTCRNTLCFTWVTNHPQQAFIFDSADLPQMTYPQFADMPNIRGSYLYYRYQSGLNDTRLRVAFVEFWVSDYMESYTADPMASDDAFEDGNFHTDVSFDYTGSEDYVPISTYIDYYAMRNNDGHGILFYEYLWDGTNYETMPWNVAGTVNNGTYYGNTPVYNAPLYSYLIEVWGNPYWNGGNPMTNPSHLFPLRVTFFIAP